MMDVGLEEMRVLRARHLGRVPARSETYPRRRPVFGAAIRQSLAASFEDLEILSELAAGARQRDGFRRNPEDRSTP